MKKKILFFEPNETLSGALIEQLIINKNFEVILVDNFRTIMAEINKSPFDLIIMVWIVKPSGFLHF